MKFFNTADPVNPEDHYCLPSLERIDLNEVLMLIEQKKYCSSCTERQTRFILMTIFRNRIESDT